MSKIKTSYYKIGTGLLTLYSSIYIFVIAALSIYIADFEELSTQSQKGALSGFYFVFVAGFINVILSMIVSLFLKKSKGAFILKVYRLVAILGVVISTVFIYSVNKSLLTKLDEMDTYSKVITAISVVLSILTLIYYLISLYTTHMSQTNYDEAENGKKNKKSKSEMKNDIRTKKNKIYLAISNMFVFFKVLFSNSKTNDFKKSDINAKNDLNTNDLQKEKVKKEKVFENIFMIRKVNLFNSFVVWISIGLLSYYFASEVNYYSEMMIKVSPIFSTMFMIQFGGAILIGFVHLFLWIADILNINCKMEIFKPLLIIQVMFVILTIVVYVITSNMNFVLSKRPDPAYYIFNSILMGVCLLAGYFNNKK